MSEPRITDILDVDVFLKRTGGDMDLAVELCELLSRDLPRLLAEIDGAVSTQDAIALERAAHTLKGVAANFAAAPATAAASTLENMGRTKFLAGADRAVEVLHREVTRLQEVLPILFGRNVP